MRIFFASAGKLLTDHRPHGEGLIAWNLLSGLAARGHDVTACAARLDLHDDPPFRAVELGAGGPSSAFAPVVHAFRAAALLRRLGGRKRFDVVHWLRPSDQLTMLYPRAVLAAGTGGLPLVVGPLARPWPPQTPGVRSARAEIAFRALTRAAEPFQRRALTRVLPLAATPDVVDALRPEWRPRAKHLPLGVDTNSFTASALPDDPAVLAIGALAPRKGIRELVEAFAAVRAACPRARLTLAGDGPERRWIERRIVELGIADGVELLGAVPPEAMPALLARTTVLVNASRGEPFGMSILEAMATARPVVAVDQGGPASLVVDGLGGRLVPPAERLELAEPLIQVLTDRAAAERMGKFNRTRIEREFSLAAVLDNLEGVYEEAAGLTTRRPV